MVHAKVFILFMQTKREFWNPGVVPHRVFFGVVSGMTYGFPELGWDILEWKCKKNYFSIFPVWLVFMFT